VLRLDSRALDATRFEELVTEGRGALDAGDAGGAARILREALALWRGRALDGADRAPTAHAEALRLDELRLEAVETRIDADLALGRDEELVPELESLVEREPLRERLHGQLMLALYRAGRQADALADYQRARATFRDRLGIEPSPRLRELEQAMLRQDAELEEGLPRLRPRRAVRRSRRAMLAVVALVVAAVIAATAAIALDRGGGGVFGVPGSVVVLDANSGGAVDAIEVGSDPVAIAFGHGSIWVANYGDGTISRIDPESRDVIRTIGVASPVDLAVSQNAIWVAGGIDGVVSRIDPDENDVVAEIDLRGTDPIWPRTVQAVAAGAGAAWAAVGNEVVRIDSATNRPTGSVDVRGLPPLALAFGHGSVWAATATGLLRVSPFALAITARTSAPGAPLRLDVTTENLVPTVFSPEFGRADLWLVNPDTARFTQTVRLAGTAVAAAEEPMVGTWAVSWSEDGEGAATRLDRQFAPISEPARVASFPTDLAVAAGAVWITIGEPLY
jgi:YVTN family beta-propeller protein